MQSSNTIILIYNSQCKILNLSYKDTLNELDKELSYFVQGYRHMPSYINGRWDGRKRLLTRRSTFPIGLLGRVKRILDKNNINYIEDDRRELVSSGKPLTIRKNTKFKERKYQKDVIETAIKYGSGTIRVATGGGKSYILSSLAGIYNIRTVIYVIGVELLYQMTNTLKELYGDIEIGMVGDGMCDIVDGINVVTVWSAAAAYNKRCDIIDNDVTKDKKKVKKENKKKIRKLIESAQLFIFDECQYLGCDSAVLLHRKSVSARYRFAFSGTPWRDSGDDILIEAAAGPKIYDISASFLIENDYLVPPHIYFVKVPTISSPGKTYQEVYKNYVVENSIRNKLIIQATHKLVKQGIKTLILVTRKKHGEYILEMSKDIFNAKFLDGSNNSEERLKIIQDLKDDKLDVVIATKIFDQGIDIPELGALCQAGPGKSSVRSLQRCGRVIRPYPGKDRAIVVDFNDNAKYLRNHSRLRKKIYKTEPLFVVKTIEPVAKQD